MAMTGTINVSTEKLLQTAGEFSEQGTTISNLTSQMVNEVSALASSWEGDASAQYIAKFKGLEDDIQVMNRMIQEHVSDLEEMAKNYQSAEEANVQEAEALLSDILS